MKTRKIFALLLAALFILAAVPAWAVIGAEVHNTTFLGAAVYRAGRSKISVITSEITLTITPGLNQIPEDDYSCRATFWYFGNDGLVKGKTNGPVGNLSSSCSKSVSSSTTSKVDFRYYLINTDVINDVPYYIDVV
ncbi:MAG: hypothetical protein II072_02615 [Clostridia bacterium]|nr:hypothetical protein [Clostridia bacterium]